jgi:hypothetical protein
MVVRDYPALTGLLGAVVVVLFGVAVVRLIEKIYICCMVRKIRAVNNARIAAASGNVLCFALL